MTLTIVFIYLKEIPRAEIQKMWGDVKIKRFFIKFP